MKIQYKDFFPEVKKKGIFSDDYETLSDILDKANVWIEDQDVDINKY